MDQREDRLKVGGFMSDKPATTTAQYINEQIAQSEIIKNQQTQIDKLVEGCLLLVEEMATLKAGIDNG